MVELINSCINNFNENNITKENYNHNNNHNFKITLLINEKLYMLF